MIAVYIASRILTACAPTEILVSGTIRDLTAGSGCSSKTGGLHKLKGIQDQWGLFAVRD